MFGSAKHNILLNNLQYNNFGNVKHKIAEKLKFLKQNSSENKTIFDYFSLIFISQLSAAFTLKYFWINEIVILK